MPYPTMGEWVEACRRTCDVGHVAWDTEHGFDQALIFSAVADKAKVKVREAVTRPQMPVETAGVASEDRARDFLTCSYCTDSGTSESIV
jgi:hypothetical protein